MTDGRSVVHAVRSDAFAGVERYICDVANELSSRGWVVQVVGGAPERMRKELHGSVGFQEAATTREVAFALRRCRGAGLVHAHMTAAEAAAVVTRPLTRAKVVSTRHFAQRRGSSGPARMLAGGLARGLALELAISDFVARAVEREVPVLLNGVRNEPLAEPSRRVLVMQRWESEKETATAIRAFRLSGLAEQGWTLRLAGRGKEETALRALVEELALTDAVDMGFASDPAAVRAEGGIFLATAPSEPFGLSVVEAMAAGLPVLAADGGAHRETVGATGRYFPPGDAEQCAAELRHLAEDEQLRRTLGIEGQERQRQFLTVSAHVDQLQHWYGTLES